MERRKPRPEPKGNEGITAEHLAAVRGIAAVNNRFGVRTDCIIAYGSRARNEGRPDSDIDVMVLVGYPQNNQPISNVILEDARHSGTSVILPHPEVNIHALFVDSGQLTKYIRRMSPVLRFNKFIKGVAQDAKVVYGEEPVIDDTPIIRYVKDKAKLTKKEDKEKKKEALPAQTLFQADDHEVPEESVTGQELLEIDEDSGQLEAEQDFWENDR